MSPYEISVMLWYYSHVGDSPEMERNPPVWASTRDYFLEADLLTTDTKRVAYRPACDDQLYHITERGRVYVDGLCNVPLPVYKIP